MEEEGLAQEKDGADFRFEGGGEVYSVVVEPPNIITLRTIATIPSEVGEIGGTVNKEPFAVVNKEFSIEDAVMGEEEAVVLVEVGGEYIRSKNCYPKYGYNANGGVTTLAVEDAEGDNKAVGIGVSESP